MMWEPVEVLEVEPKPTLRLGEPELGAERPPWRQNPDFDTLRSVESGVTQLLRVEDQQLWAPKPGWLCMRVKVR